MIKIALLIQSWHIGGIETALYNIANNLKNTFDFHFIATDNPEINPNFLNIGEASYLGRNWDKIADYLKSNKINIVQWGNVSEYKDCALKAEVPIIIERISGPRSTRTNHQNNSAIICSSEGIVPTVKTNYSGQIVVIKNGYDLSSLPPTPNRLHFEKNDFVIIYPAARMGEGQAYDVAIKAVLLARKTNPRIKLILLGDTPNQKGYKNIRNSLETLASPMGKDCVFTGFVLDPEPYLSGADLCISPAKSHGISNALIQSSMFKKPLISSKVGQANEICHTGENGFLFECGDYHKLSEYILLLSNDHNKCKTFGEYGYNLVKKDFNITNQAKKYKDLYLSLIEAGNP